MLHRFNCLRSARDRCSGCLHPRSPSCPWDFRGLRSFRCSYNPRRPFLICLSFRSACSRCSNAGSRCRRLGGSRYVERSPPGDTTVATGNHGVPRVPYTLIPNTGWSQIIVVGVHCSRCWGICSIRRRGDYFHLFLRYFGSVGFNGQ